MVVHRAVERAVADRLGSCVEMPAAGTQENADREGQREELHGGKAGLGNAVNLPVPGIEATQKFPGGVGLWCSRDGYGTVSLLTTSNGAQPHRKRCGYRRRQVLAQSARLHRSAELQPAQA